MLAPRFIPDGVAPGEVAERLKAAVLKTADVQTSGGSNPSLSVLVFGAASSLTISAGGLSGGGSTGGIAALTGECDLAR